MVERIAQWRVAGAKALPLLVQHAEGIGQAIEGVRRQYRRVHQCEQALAQRKEVPGQVAAVHGGDIARRQRRQGFGVVPVQEVAAMARQLVQRAERQCGAFGDRALLQIAEVPCRQIGQQGQPDVGRRGAPRHHQCRMFLDVVRRQPVILLAHPGLEERPGAPRQPAKERPLGIGKLGHDRGRRPTQPRHQPGRERPRHQEGQGERQRLRAQHGHHRNQRECQQRPRRHHPPFRATVAAQAALDFAGGVPLQQVAARNGHAPERAQYRAPGQQCFVGQAGNLRGGAQQRLQRAAPDLDVMRFQRRVVRHAQGIAKHADQRRCEPQRQYPRGPCGGVVAVQPARHQQDQRGDGHQAPAQVVQQLATRQQAEPVAFPACARARGPRQQPGQQLPVATDPARTALGVGGVAFGVILVQAHIADQARAGIAAFQQVVAEDAVLWQAALERMLEGFHVIDALAHERTFVEQVLIDVRDHAGIRIDAGLAAEHPRKARGTAPAQAGAHAGLQDAVALHHALQRRIEAWPVEWVGQGGDERTRRIARELRVRIQGDDIAHAEQDRRVTYDAHERASIAMAEQGIERGQLAALALVPHPHPFTGVPLPGAVQQVEAVAALGRVALVQSLDALRGVRKQGVVGRQLRFWGVEEIRQQHEAQLGIAVGQEADLQRFDQDVDAVGAGQHRRYRHHGGAVRGNPLAEIQLGQRSGRDQHGRGPVDQHDAQLTEHQQPEQGAQPDGNRACACGKQPTGGQHRQQGNRQQVLGKWHAMRQPTCLAVAWRGVGHRVNGGMQAFADQPIAHMRAWPVGRRSSPGQLQRDGGNPFLGDAAAAGDLLHHVAIGIAGAEVHLRVDGHGVFAEPLLDHAHVFDKGAPIHGGQEAQAADAVADGHLVGGLLLPLGGHQFFDTLPGCRCPLFQPGDGHGPRAAATLQRTGQLGDECAGQRRLGARHVRHHQDHIGGGVGGRTVEIISPLRGQAPVFSIAHHPRGHAPQVLQQCQAQHDGNGPQFAQAQRREGLIGGDEAAQRIAVDASIAVRDGLHRKLIYTWQPGRGAGGKRRQLPAVATRQVAPRGLDLFFDQVVVVEQPFTGRGDRALFTHHTAEQGVGVLQDTFVGLQALEQALRAGSHPHAVLARKCTAVDLHLFNAVQRGPQRALGGFNGRGRGLPLTPAPTNKPPQAKPTAEKTTKVGHKVPRGEAGCALHPCI